MSRPRLLLLFAVVLGLLLAAAWFVLPALRRANPTFVPHSSAAAAAVAGTVVDADGKPVGGVAVTWFAAEVAGGGFLATRMFRGGDHEVVTGTDGTFLFENVPTTDGFASISGQAPRFEGGTGELTPRAGFIARDLRLHAEPIPPTRRLRGLLCDPAGKPLAFASVQAVAKIWWGSWQSMTTTDADGRFELVAPRAAIDAELTWHPVGGDVQPLGSATFGQDVQLATPRAR